MGRPKKFNYQAVIENKLAEHPDGFSLDELLAFSELKVDRSTLFRHLTRLIERGQAERIGNARASRYRLPCTRPIALGEDVRAGRWWWEDPTNKECGLHVK